MVKADKNPDPDNHPGFFLLNCIPRKIQRCEVSDSDIFFTSGGCLHARRFEDPHIFRFLGFTSRRLGLSLNYFVLLSLFCNSGFLLSVKYCMNVVC